MTTDERTDRYLAELYRWNEKMNLTTVPRKKAREVLIEPSLAMLEFIANEALHVVDIGSGSGIPAIVLAVHRPLCRFTLVESNNKKSSFLTHIAITLKLENVAVIGKRAERVAEELRGNADIVTARAVTHETVLSSAERLLKKDGYVLTHRSSKVDIEHPRFVRTGENRYVNRFGFIGQKV